MKIEGLDGVKIGFSHKAQRGFGGIVLTFVNKEKNTISEIDLCLTDAESLGLAIVKVVREVEDAALSFLTSKDQGKTDGQDG